MVICRPAEPVPSADTVVLDGLNTQAAYDGSEPHASVNVTDAPIGLVRINWYEAVCPLEIVWLEAPEGPA